MFEQQTRRQEGKRVLIGDNLRTHLSVAGLDFCAEHNKLFKCLPPNATDKMQPLDVGFFRSLKGMIGLLPV